MALNLNTLTGSTSSTVLAEALTTADFLDSVPILTNLANRGNKGGDAKQTTGLNQPRALPLIDGKGYFYNNGLPNNYASVPDAAALDVSGDLTLEVNVTIPDILPNHTQRLLSKYNTNTGNRSYQLALLDTSKLQFTISSDGSFQAENSKISTSSLSSRGIVDGQQITIKVTWRQSDGRVQFFFKTSNGSFAQLGIDQTANAGSIYNSNTNVNIGATNEGQITNIFKGAFHSAKIYASINETNKVLDVDFAATNIRHGDTKFKCLTGQVVTVNQSGNDPAKIIKRSVLRFANKSDNSTNIALQGLLTQTITDGYFFAAFSVLGDGGESHGRIFGLNSTGAADNVADGFAIYRDALTNDYRTNYDGNTLLSLHDGLFDDSMGDVLFESSFKNSSQISQVNNADKDNGTGTFSGVLSSEEFKIASFSDGSFNVALDLEYLALFPSLTDVQADSVREYIRAKTQVYDLPTPIKNDYSVSFDGTDDYMSMTLPVLGNTHTLSAWFKTTASYGGAGSEGTLISYISSGGGGDDSVLSVITNKVGWSDFVDDDQTGTSTVNDGNWHHAVAVVTATTQKIYVDGVLETTTSNAYSAGTSFSSATIGRRANFAQRFFNGNIDEVAIWDSALTANEVKSVYNDGKPVNLSGQPELYSSANNLVAWWRMGDNDSGTGSTVTDNSANSYNGTLINGPTFQTNTP